MTPELREATDMKLVTNLAGLLKGAEPGSGAQLIVAKTLIGVARSKSTCELIRGRLHDEEVPTNLIVNTEMRWLIVAALARRGVFGKKEITAELERDNTNTDIKYAAGAHSNLSTPEVRAEAWRLVTTDSDVPNETHRSIATGSVNYGQGDVLVPYMDAYAKLAETISKHEDGWNTRDYAVIGAVLRWLSPETLATADVVGQLRRYLEEGKPTDQVRYLLSERLNEAERDLRVQEHSRR